MDKRAAGAEPFRVLSVEELGDLHAEQIGWVIEGLFPAGAVVLLVGRPKAGKSLLTVDMLASVALGEPFLGRATRRGPALYVPAEDALRLVRERLESRLRGARNVPLHVVPVDRQGNGVRLDDPVSLGRLTRTVVAVGASLVVLDPLRELHRQQENDAAMMAAILRPLRQVARATDALIVVNHHRNKHASDPAQASRGSSAIAGAVDVVATMDVPDDGAARPGVGYVVRLHVEGRYGRPLRLAARLGAGLRWEVLDEGIEGAPIRERVWRVLEGSGEGMTAAEVAARVRATTSKVQAALRGLVGEGAIERTGVGTKVDPFRYRPVDGAVDTNAGQE